MFKKSRIKIVAAIMGVLTLLWLGTLALIYLSSYFEVNATNLEMLKEYSALYALDRPDGGAPVPNGPMQDKGPHADTDRFKLSTFYSVAVSYDGEVLKTENAQNEVLSDEELQSLAQSVLDESSSDGVINGLIYYKTDKGGYTLVAFMDNTIIRGSMGTLFRYTLIFGGAAIVLLFFVAVYLAKRIVSPLEESYEKQKQFISDAGHELKTPVSVVSANAELLSREIGENQWLDNIRYENERMGSLVGQLLELARTENVKPQTEELDLSRLVAGGTLAFESVAFEHGQRLNTEIKDNVTVVGDADRLAQLVSILVDNAIRHGKDGGEVLVRLTQTKNAAVLSVVNDGDPIPKETAERLFERFYRADEARSSEEKHYGLGLAIAKAIVSSHKGKLELKCHDGKVEFTATIPQKQKI